MCRTLYAHLDVDMNAGGPQSREPVENVFISNKLPIGNYVASIHNYSKRESADTGFEVEIEHGGELRTYGSPKSPGNQKHFKPAIEFQVTSVDGNVVFKDNSMSKTTAGIVKWGLKTGSWQRVNAVTLSPNHWTTPIGNKHHFFLLEGCVADERIRPFYNEFLNTKLKDERKTTEMLANKIEVTPAEGNQLSGLGFSDTIRNHVFVEVTGSFKRIVKVKF